MIRNTTWIDAYKSANPQKERDMEKYIECPDGYIFKDENGNVINTTKIVLEKLIEPKFKVGDRIRYKRNNRVKLNIESININEQFYHTGNIGRMYFKYQDDYELVPNKFNISSLKPFDKVLVRGTNQHCWHATLYSHYIGIYFYTLSGLYAQCIPFEDNKHLLGTKNNCDEFYKTWEE